MSCINNPAPKLIDNKIKHLERQLSAAQRDEISMQESQDDAMFKRDIALVICESNEIAKSMQSSSSSLLAQGMNRSMEMFSRNSERLLSQYFIFYFKVKVNSVTKL